MALSTEFIRIHLEKRDSSGFVWKKAIRLIFVGCPADE